MDGVRYFGTVVELPEQEWRELVAWADAEDRTISQQATRLVRLALRARQRRTPGEREAHDAA